MKHKRIVSILLVLAMLMSFVPTTAIAVDLQDKAVGLAMRMTGVQDSSVVENGLKFTLSLKSGSNKLGSGTAFYLQWDNTVLTLMNIRGSNKGTAPSLTPGSNLANVSGAFESVSDWSATVSKAKINADSTVGIYNASLSIDEPATYADYVDVGEFLFQFKEGKGISDLTQDTVCLPTDASTASAMVLLSDGTDAFKYKSAVSGAWRPQNDSLNDDCFSIAYPRSTATGTPTINGGEGVTLVHEVPEDPTSAVTEIQFVAPEFDKTYQTATPLAVPTIGGLAEKETAKFQAGVIYTEDAVTLSIDEDGKVTSNMAIPLTFMGGTAKVTIAVTAAADAGYDSYEAVVDVKIPKVVLPAATLSKNAVTVVEQDPAQTVAAALAGMLDTQDADWVLYTNQMTSTETPVDGSTQLTVAGMPEGGYKIPVYKDEVANTTRASVDVLTVTVIAAPKQDDINNLVAGGRYTPTTVSLKFDEATNTDWEYALTADAPVAAAEGDENAAELGVWKTGAVGGVTFNNLTPGSNYYLQVRAAVDTTTVVTATDPATTLYDLELAAAYLNKDSATKVPSIITGEGNVYAAPKQVITADNLSDYSYKLEIRNNNGAAIYKVSAAVYNVDSEGNITSTPSEVFTANIDGTGEDGLLASVANGNDFVVTVSAISADKLARGSNKAIVLVTAYASADGTTPVVNKEFPIELVAYGSRGDATGTDDIVLRKVSSKPETPVEGDTNVYAETGTKVELNVAWGSIEPDSYSVPEGTTSVSVAKEADGKWYMTLNEDIDELGKVVEITATANESETDHYLEDTATVKVCVKAGASEALPDTNDKEDGENGSVEYFVVRGSEAQTIDLLEKLTGVAGATVVENSGLDGVSLTGSTVTVVAESTDSTVGLATYTVTIPATESYDEGTVSVVLYVMHNAALDAMDPLDLLYADGALRTEAGTDLGGELSLPPANISGVAASGATYTLTVDDTAVTDFLTTDGTKIDVSKLRITGPAVIKVTATVPADKTNFIAKAVGTQTITVRVPADLSGTDAYAYSEKDIEVDATLGKNVALDIAANGDTAATITYAVTTGSSLVEMTDATHFSIKDGVYGEAIITATSSKTTTHMSGTKEIKINIRKKNDGTSKDPDMGDPYNGTGADILGRLPADSIADENYKNKFDKDADEDGTMDMWEAAQGGVKFDNLKLGVRYEVRFMYANSNQWFNVGNQDANGWSDLNEGNPMTQNFMIVEPVAGNAIAAQIRYKDDGTVGPTTEEGPTANDPEDGKWSSIIHNLNSKLNYKYRVKKADDTFDTTFEGADANGWIELPMKDAEPQVAPNDTALYQYKVVRDFEIKSVETSYTTKPGATIDEHGDFIITGLVPGANYDITSFTKEFTDTPEKNYITKRASAEGSLDAEGNPMDPGVIIIKFSEDAGSEYVELEIAANKKVNIRMSQTPDTDPGEKLPVSAGVKVSGVVNSYSPAKAAKVYLVKGTVTKGESGEDVVTYPSFRNDDRDIVEESIYAVVDSSVVAVSDDTAQDGEQHEQTFEFSSVEAGTYMLIVTKDSHADYTVQGIEVGNDDVALTDHSNSSIQLMTLIAGDLDASGMVDAADLAILVSTRNYDSETPENAASNIDGIGSVDAADLAILVSTRNYDVEPIVINYK